MAKYAENNETRTLMCAAGGQKSRVPQVVDPGQESKTKCLHRCYGCGFGCSVSSLQVKRVTVEYFVTERLAGGLLKLPNEFCVTVFIFYFFFLPRLVIIEAFITVFHEPQRTSSVSFTTTMLNIQLT